MFSKTAEFYDLFYEGKDYARESEKLHHIIKKHKRSKGDRLLDIACGTGQHAVYLKRLYDVEGLDLDEGLLELARRRNPELKFHHASMLDFRLPGKFDVIACLFSSIGYAKTVDNLNKAIASMSSHLNPGGVLIVEPWFDKETYYPGVAHALLVDKPEVKACRMNVSRIEHGMSILDFNYLVAVPHDTVRHFTETHELGLFSKDEHMQAFRKSGLDVFYDHEGLTGRGLYIGEKLSEEATA